jgi:hypothetical protein
LDELSRDLDVVALGIAPRAELRHHLPLTVTFAAADQLFGVPSRRDARRGQDHVQAH